MSEFRIRYDVSTGVDASNGWVTCFWSLELADSAQLFRQKPLIFCGTELAVIPQNVFFSGKDYADQGLNYRDKCTSLFYI